MSYEQNMSDKYDSEFSEAIDPHGLQWYPWVGKDYHKTGIFILGMSTDTRDGGDWTQEIESPLTSRDASRVYFDFDNEDEHKPFQSTSEMFLAGAGKEHDERTREIFWSSVAFNNFFQKALEPGQQVWEVSEELREEGRKAFHATTKIIQPKLVVVWGVETTDAIGAEKCDEYINGANPRFSNQMPPIVGIKHPSGTGQGFDSDKWFDFLRSHPISKNPIENFLQHLKQQIQ